MVDVGAECQKFHDATVIGVNSQRVQCDEIWSFVYAKEKSVDNTVAAPDKAGDAFAQLVKIYGSSECVGSEKRYSSAEFAGTKKTIIAGKPDADHISTSYVERQNLTMRMHMRRFTRLTNGFSKKIENHCHAIALHFVYHSFRKFHKTLRITPAMEAKLATRPMTIQQIVELTD